MWGSTTTTRNIGLTRYKHLQTRKHNYANPYHYPPRLPIVYTNTEILQKLDYLAGIHGSKKAAIEAAICELYRQAVIPVVCLHCGAEYADFTHDAEFIGWIGVCAKCVLVDGVEI